MNTQNTLKENLWIKKFQSSDERPPLQLYCFHHVGGGASMFKHWKDPLSDLVEVFAIQLPGRENRLQDSLFNDSDSLIDEISAAIRENLDDRPYIFFGHSMGASLSLLVANALKDYQKPIGIIISARTPDFCDEENYIPPEITDQQLLSRILKFGGIPEDILCDQDLLTWLMPRIKSDFFLASHLHKAQVKLQPFEIPIIALGGISDALVSMFDLTNWSRYTTKYFNALSLPGGHFYINNKIMVLKYIRYSVKKIIAEKNN